MFGTMGVDWPTYFRNDRSLRFMSPKPRLSVPTVIETGFIVVILAGLAGGCSKPSSANVDLTKAREALAKRTADYGESPRNQQSRAKDKAPVQHR
jgi:hypothetical protein